MFLKWLQSFRKKSVMVKNDVVRFSFKVCFVSIEIKVAILLYVTFHIVFLLLINTQIKKKLKKFTHFVQMFIWSLPKYICLSVNEV